MRTVHWRLPPRWRCLAGRASSIAMVSGAGTCLYEVAWLQACPERRQAFAGLEAEVGHSACVARHTPTGQHEAWAARIPVAHVRCASVALASQRWVTQLVRACGRIVVSCGGSDWEAMWPAE